MRLRHPLALCAFLATLAGVQQASALSFAFNFASGVPASVQAAFVAAGARWSSRYSDPITVNIDADYRALGSGILGQAGSSRENKSYASVRGALVADAASPDDATAVANLQAGAAVSTLMNYTSNNGGSATRYLDSDGGANNSSLYLTFANAKALGLRPANDSATDASIAFSSSFTWDFDPSDGITAGSYDFLGVAAHELGHALGFISGVDYLDFYGGTTFSDNAYDVYNTLDLFRYSNSSSFGTRLDWSAGDNAKYFSIDGGTTVGPTFSTGVYKGDGRQASHWKDNLGIGIMDPTAASGELLAITANDERAIDVIGYDPVPEPATLAALSLGIAAMLRRRKR